MRKALVLLATLLPLAAGPAIAADSPGIGGILKDAATQAAGQAAQDTLDKHVKGDTATKGSRDRTDRNWKGRDRDDARSSSYDSRRDGRGDQDNPGRGHGKGRGKKDRD